MWQLEYNIIKISCTMIFKILIAIWILLLKKVESIISEIVDNVIFISIFLDMIHMGLEISSILCFWTGESLWRLVRLGRKILGHGTSRSFHLLRWLKTVYVMTSATFCISNYWDQNLWHHTQFCLNDPSHLSSHPFIIFSALFTDS